jgi:hypothetical protein
MRQRAADALEGATSRLLLIVFHRYHGDSKYLGRVAHSMRKFAGRYLDRVISLSLIGSLQTIASEDLEEFLEQIETEQEAYEAVKEVHDKIVDLLRDSQANAAANDG